MSDQDYSDRILLLSTQVGDAGTLARMVAAGEVTGMSASCAMHLTGQLLERLGDELEAMSRAMKGEPYAEQAYQAIAGGGS